jgi:hypothetical protein
MAMAATIRVTTTLMTEPSSDEELRRGRLGEVEIEPARANQFRKLRQVGHEQHLENLLDQHVGGDQQQHLPLAPARDDVDLQVKKLNEAQLEPEPGQVDDDPEDEVGLEHELAHDGVADLGQPDAGITDERGHT